MDDRSNGNGGTIDAAIVVWLAQVSCVVVAMRVVKDDVADGSLLRRLWY